MQADDAEHWAPPNVIAMLQASADDVSAFMLAVNALTPAELRACARTLDLPDLDDLRQLTIVTVTAARGLNDDAAAALNAWARLLRTNRTEAVRTYLDETRKRHEHP